MEHDRRTFLMGCTVLVASGPGLTASVAVPDAASRRPATVVRHGHPVRIVAGGSRAMRGAG